MDDKQYDYIIFMPESGCESKDVLVPGLGTPFCGLQDRGQIPELEGMLFVLFKMYIQDMH